MGKKTDYLRFNLGDFINNFEFGKLPKSYVNNVKVIFNPPATILFINGKKYISKAHDEEFDKEKGLLMCLAKAGGYSHIDIKKIIKNAKENTK